MATTPMNKIKPESPDNILKKSNKEEAAVARIAHVNAVIDKVNEVIENVQSEDLWDKGIGLNSIVQKTPQSVPNVATGNHAVVEGANNVASGNYSHAEGLSTMSSGNYSHAQGYRTRSVGVSSFAGGSKSVAAQSNTCAIGKNTSVTSYLNVEGAAQYATYILDVYVTGTNGDYKTDGGENLKMPYSANQGVTWYVNIKGTIYENGTPGVLNSAAFETTFSAKCNSSGEPVIVGTGIGGSIEITHIDNGLTAGVSNDYGIGISPGTNGEIIITLNSYNDLNLHSVIKVEVVQSFNAYSAS